MIWMALFVGRPATRAFLYPICIYYLMCSAQASRAIRPYLIRALGRSIGWRDLYRQYHCFASTLLDRIYLLTGQGCRFDIDIWGLDVLNERLARRHGCLLLGSHLGSFEIVRAMGLTQGQNWDLEELGLACADDGDYTFLLDATPQPFTGGLGSPVNPVVIR